MFVMERIQHVRPSLFELLPFSHVFNDSSRDADGIVFEKLVVVVGKWGLIRLRLHEAK
jgi:hypothetical protein